MNIEIYLTISTHSPHFISFCSLLLVIDHVGTIFSVWEKTTPGPPTVADILRPGREMICAGYCCYGSATEMVLTYGHGQGVQRFTLDPSLGTLHERLYFINYFHELILFA